MEIALGSVAVAALLAYLGFLGQQVFKLHGLMHQLDARGAERHAQVVTAIHAVAREGREHTDKCHGEAMAAIAEQGKRTDDLRKETVAGIAAAAKRTDDLRVEAMAEIGRIDREHREQREKLHAETMAEFAASREAHAGLSERTAVLEAKVL